MFYYVCGQDQIYKGLHGLMYDAIVEGSEEDAIEAAIELADDVIESYSCITNLLEDDIAELCEKQNIDYKDYFSWTTEQEEIIEEIRTDVYEQDRDFFIVLLDKEKLPTLDPYDLDAILHKIGRSEFLDKYRLEE